MFAALYTFTVKPGREKELLKSWTELTRLIYQYEGSLGSRIHRVGELKYVAYAQWPNRETWENMGSKLPPEAKEWSTTMRDCCSEIDTLHEMEMEVDLLKSDVYSS
ncbi:MAG: antibiotic biosynthesis monooxygenase [Flavobacteriales bacterium]|nr:antibiotic biosynthesis monooxygenase [Flavobacteriales bacterium]